MKTLFIRMAGIVAMLTALSLSAQPSPQLEYGPFSGYTGYQEVKITDQSWYVAFHGDRQTSLEYVKAGWHARAAELCTLQNAAYYVEMRYVREPLLVDDREAERSQGSLIPAAGYIYVPIFTQRSAASVSVIAPSKLAAVRCVTEISSLREPSRAVSVGKALEDAAKVGIRIKPIGK